MFSHPNPYPTTNPHIRQGHVLSPFWSDVDIRREGAVRYVEITRDVSALSDKIMDQASLFINERFISENESTYSPTWMLVAQWDGVHPHPHGADDHEGIDEEYLDKVCNDADKVKLQNNALIYLEVVLNREVLFQCHVHVFMHCSCSLRFSEGIFLLLLLVTGQQRGWISLFNLYQIIIKKNPSLWNSWNSACN